ncbi:hypothetical protein FOA43_002173 [Brettanomyces nanus]|uniref:RNA-binding protein n=1 Tax=Eeniella nana TaxID=13502 RepID=A0A875RUQ5_EENNA|nr:uncharacterized protein FOA43_002173 [Brettanomyces nanus]QPG74837.1 hypothetical protein FOA43_002173 [Brettanomyces nanus]
MRNEPRTERTTSVASDGSFPSIASSTSTASTAGKASLEKSPEKSCDTDLKVSDRFDDSSAYVFINISSTGSEQMPHTNKDSSEIIEIAWSIVDCEHLETISSDSRLVKPINTPITPLCSSLTGLTWNSVKDAGSLNEAIIALDKSIQKHLISNKRSFNFITFDSWDLRMRVPKESREKSIELPQYLKYPKYFDLRREFVRYEEASKGELYASGSISEISLGQVMDVLKLSPVDAPSPISNIGDLDTFTSASSATIQSLLLIFSALVDASTLSKPHDMGLDLSQFFSERSKVLYITNLPLDVTQGELESWFTQFGCRPIAFWTIKSPLPEFGTNSNFNNSNAIIMRSTCSGFVIFASHESASDSLAMNGRILNDRIVEVQPSSLKVLDKAQDILTPFPSSKNRPRPGDWTCPSCGFSNFQRRTACFRCSFPVASAQTVQDSIYANANANPSNGNVNGGGSPGDLVNSGIGDSFFNHHRPHPNGHHTQHQNGNHSYNTTNSGNNSNNYNNYNNNYNNSNNNVGNRQNLGSSNVPFRAGDWKCMNENCAYHNFAKNVCCLKCGAPRVQSAILTGHQHNSRHNNGNNNVKLNSFQGTNGYSKRPFAQSNFTQFVSQLQPFSQQNTSSLADTNFDTLSAQINGLNLGQPQSQSQSQVQSQSEPHPQPEPLPQNSTGSINPAGTSIYNNRADLAGPTMGLNMDNEY